MEFLQRFELHFSSSRIRTFTFSVYSFVTAVKWGMEMHGTLIYASIHKHSEAGQEPGCVPFRQSLLSADGPLMAPQLATKSRPMPLAGLGHPAESRRLTATPTPPWVCV